MIKNFLSFERKVGAFASTVARAFLVLAVCAALWQVAARFILRDPSVWTEVATRVLLIWCIFCGIVVAFRRGALVSVDLVMRIVNDRNRRRLQLLLAIIQIAFLTLLVKVGFEMAWLTRFQNIVVLDIPMSFAYLAIPIGALLSILAVVAHYIDPTHRELETAL